MKIATQLAREQLDEIRSLVAAGHAANVSEFVQHAVRVALQDVAEWQVTTREALNQTGGPLTDEERKWVDAILGVER